MNNDVSIKIQYRYLFGFKFKNIKLFLKVITFLIFITYFSIS